MTLYNLTNLTNHGNIIGIPNIFLAAFIAILLLLMVFKIIVILRWDV